MGEEVVAFVPARSGSKRIVGKNLRPLGGHPLLAYTVVAAYRAGVFTSVFVSTDDPVTADAARHYGADVPVLRPVGMAGDTSPDIDWVRHALGVVRESSSPAAFAILRPTSPLRRPETIASAVDALLGDPEADSLRAVEPARQHPGKMWVLDTDERRMRPLLDDGGAIPPWHSRPYQALPPVYVQNASLEVARVRAVDLLGSIAGNIVRPLVSEGYDGYDLNDEWDWALLEHLLLDGRVELPDLGIAPWTTTATLNSE